jgi:hypothetical protein
MRTCEPRIFTYQMTDYGNDIKIVIPHIGYLDAIENELRAFQVGDIKFKFARALSNEVVDYCIDLIEGEHTSRSKKSANLLRLCNCIVMADQKYRSECATRALNFLHDNACLIGPGIVTDLEIDKEDVQQRIGQEFLELVFHRIMPYLDDSAVRVAELLEQYSCYFQGFFNHQPKNARANGGGEPNKNQLATALDFMKVLDRCGIEVPEYFENTRAQVLTGFAKRAFDIVSNPVPHRKYHVQHLMGEFRSKYSPDGSSLGLKSNDPVAYVCDGQDELLIAKYHDGQMALIFNSSEVSIVARTSEQLLSAAALVDAEDSYPFEATSKLLQMARDIR